MAEPATMVVVEHHNVPNTVEVSRYVVSASTCTKIAILSFGIGLIVGFNLNKRVRRFANRMLKKLKEP